MYELLYTSVSTRRMSAQDLDELLVQARERNKRQGITGMLIFNGIEFLQLLEGEEADVRDVYASIQQDERHRSVDIFYSGSIATRTFVDWSMAYRLLDSESRQLLGPDLQHFAAEEFPHQLLYAKPNIGKELFLSLRQDLL